MSRDTQSLGAASATTEQQLSTNRQNVPSSSGPKSAYGKRIAALNAIKHGLTMQVSQYANSTIVSEIADLIDVEIGDRMMSERIASKMVDLERTLLTMQAVALKQSHGEDEFIASGDLDEIASDRALAADLLAFVRAHVDDPELVLREKHLVKYFMTMGRRFETMSNRRFQKLQRNAFSESIALRRYFKRASNQLIKAVRAVAKQGRTVWD